VRSSIESLTRALSHMLWLGGSVCAGKSSIARTLGAEYGLQPELHKTSSPEIS
jgi:adenylylsulfate kinase-like enzyme